MTLKEAIEVRYNPDHDNDNEFSDGRIHMTRDEFIECALRSLQAIISVASVPREEAVRRAVDYAKSMKAEIESIKV